LKDFLTPLMPLPTDHSERLQRLIHWLGTLDPALELRLATLQPASSDASFRRYFRLESAKSTLIVMDAPPPNEDCRPFVDVSKRLGDVGLTVPKVLAQDLKQGFLLLTDLGRQTYQERIEQGLEDAELQTLYRDALLALVKLQQADTTGLAEFSQARLVEELGLFTHWYIEQYHGVSPTPEQLNQLDAIFILLAKSMASEPQVLVHRDFHSPNLMVCTDPAVGSNPGVIDFQDAVVGPISYDIASLVFDARTTWEEPQQLDWAIRYWEKARAANLPVPEDFAQFHRQYEWASLQRNLRILGVFARLSIRDNKPHYLAHVPRVLQYTRQVTSRYGPFSPLARLLNKLENVKPETRLTF
jgi:aminoglycoside/choline kinase family phosphotransferase